MENTILESQKFYDLMQNYRIAPMLEQENVINKFENVKEFIKNEFVERSKHLKAVEMLKYFTDFPDEDFEEFTYADKFEMTVMVHKIAEAKQLIKEATEI